MGAPSRIFLSYRRGDTAGHVGRLHDELVRYFGRERVFMDIDGIKPGEDFLTVLEERLTEAAVVLVVIGTRWSGPREDGTRRIDDPRDFVRLEVATALERTGTVVVPVLCDGATMPSDSTLPARLAPLARRNAFVLSDLRWKQDVAALFESVRPHVPLDAAGGPSTSGRTPMLLAGAALLALLLLWAPWKPDPMQAVTGISADIPKASEGKRYPEHPIKDARRQLDRAKDKWMDDAYLSSLRVDCNAQGVSQCSLQLTFVSDSRAIGLSAWLGVRNTDGWMYSQFDGTSPRDALPVDVLEFDEVLEKATSAGLVGSVEWATLEMHRANDGVDHPVWLLFPASRASAGNDLGFCFEARTGDRVRCSALRG